MVVEIARVGALASIELAEPLSFSLAEMVLLVGLCGASLGIFLWRFWPIGKNILHAKKDVGFSLTHVGRRVWEFVSEVVCQSKVIRQRPLPGLAHAFVFWGFLAFALVTINHVLTGLRVGVLQHTGIVGEFYFDFVALWALLVAVSIAGLFVRRFFVRPRWLGKKVSIESGVIAGLIFLLMVSYLAAFTLPADSASAESLVVGAHADAAGVSADHSGHEASAPCAEPADGVFEARWVLGYSEAE